MSANATPPDGRGPDDDLRQLRRILEQMEDTELPQLALVLAILHVSTQVKRVADLLIPLTMTVEPVARVLRQAALHLGRLAGDEPDDGGAGGPPTVI